MSLFGSRMMWANRAKASLSAAKLFSTTKFGSQLISPSLKNSSLKLTSPKLITLNENKRNYSTENKDLKEKFDALVKNKDIVVFMKGTPEQPQCGFSRAVCQILEAHGANFESHNVLADEEIRQGVKEYTEWPTIPQIFFKGEFIGGCDILLEMHRSGDIVDELQAIGITSVLAEPEEKK